MGRGGFEPPKRFRSGFTARPIWPLWYLPKVCTLIRLSYRTDCFPFLLNWLVLVPLCFLPALFLFVHTVDARTGTFIFPTMYSIPVAYLTGALLLIAAGAGLAL